MECPACGEEISAGKWECPKCAQASAASGDTDGSPVPLPRYHGNFPRIRPEGMASISLAMGILGILSLCLPQIGLPSLVIGLVLGRQGYFSKKRWIAVAGIILSVIGLCIGIILILMVSQRARVH